MQKFALPDTQVLERLAEYMLDNSGNPNSPNKIAGTLDANKVSTNHVTVGRYMSHLRDAFVFYEARRYDIKGRRCLSIRAKHYVGDTGMRYVVLGTRNLDWGRMYENAVFLELLRRGYEVYVGKLYQKEVDFVAKRGSELVYIQVSDDISSQSTIERVLSSLLSILSVQRHASRPFSVIEIGHLPVELAWKRGSGNERRAHTMTIYRTEYESDLIGPLTLASDGGAIVGCWFGNDRYFGYGVDGEMEPRDDLPVFDRARAWLDRYFAGEAPDPRELPLSAHTTPFQLRVREAMLDIPYGQTTTYGDIANRIASETGKRSSARAVGGAVGHNPLCIIAPCHRVVGADGSLTGFGGGIDMKVKLLEHEGVDLSRFYRPKRGTAIDPASWGR